LEAEYVHDITELAKETPWRRRYEPIRYCTHSLGPVLRWVGEELVSVSCFDTGSHIYPGSGEHDAMVAIFRTASNVVVKVLCSFVNRHPRAFHRFVYYGTQGYFERSAPTGSGRQETLFSSGAHGAGKGLTVLPIGEGRPDASRADMHGGADWLMLEDFVRAIATGGPSPIGVREALRMALPGLYALESARRGGERVDIRYPWNS
jgi:predicted dehydrogenase